MSDNKTTITITNSYGSATITSNKIDMTIDEVVDELFKPVLLSLGYHVDTVNEVFSE